MFHLSHHARVAVACTARQYASAATATVPRITDDQAGAVQDTPPKKKSSKKPKTPPPINLLDESHVHKFLADLSASEHILSLADLERHKPPKYMQPEQDYNQYLLQYRTLQATLQSSFNVKQLAQFLRLYNLQLPTLKNKHLLTTTIIEQAWRWPSLKAVVARRKDQTETLTHRYPLDPCQSFLLLGKDGVNLHDLSVKYRLQMTLSSNPLSLKATGLRGNINAIGQYISEFKENIRHETYAMPTKTSLNSDALQRVSRSSGAFIENCGDGEIKITYTAESPKSLLLAKRHATRSSSHVSSSTEVDLLAHVPTTASGSKISYNYSLFPFINSRALPWTTEVGGAFRLRRVGEWFGFGATDQPTNSGVLFSAEDDVISLSDQYSELRARLESLGAFDGRKILRAFTGHVLLTTPASSRGTLSHPLSGSWPLPKIFTWLRKNSSQRVFIPSIPTLLADQATTRLRFLHRLVYQVFKAKQDEGHHEPVRTIKFEMILQPGEEEAVDVKNPLAHRCFVGTESSFHLMLPNRPLDLQMSISDMNVLEQNSWPPELKRYVSYMDAYLQDETNGTTQPNETPLTFTHGGSLYILKSSESVRQQLSDTNSISTTESLLDLEANRKSSQCIVTCNEPTSPAQWNDFVVTCDRLSQEPAKD